METVGLQEAGAVTRLVVDIVYFSLSHSLHGLPLLARSFCPLMTSVALICRHVLFLRKRQLDQLKALA